MRIYWKAPTSGNFLDQSKWSTGIEPPSYADIAVITIPGIYTVTVDLSQTVLGLQIGKQTTFLVPSGNTFQMTEGTATGANRGLIDVSDNASLLIGGTVENIGSINVTYGGHPTALEVLYSSVLDGGGTINLSGAPIQLEPGQSLTNVDNTIQGWGAITGTSLFMNGVKGVVDANVFANLTVAVPDVQNSGLLEATNQSLLFIGPDTVNDSTGGIINAAGSNAGVNLEGTDVVGGTLQTSDGGAISVFDDSVLDGGVGHVVTNTGVLSIADNASLELIGTIDNKGAIENAGDTASVMLQGGQVTLEGDGDLQLTGFDDLMAGSGLSTPTELINDGNTISGQGIIDNVVLNNGKGSLIDANDTVPLIVDTGTSTIVNAGTLQSEFGEELYIGSPVNNSGAIVANGTIAIAGAVTGKGTAAIHDAGVLEFGAASAASVTFAGPTGELILDQSGAYTGTISGFADSTQSIDLADIDDATAVPTFSGTTLTVKDGEGDVAKLKFGGKHTLASFHLTDDGSGGTLITDPTIDSAAHTVADGTTLELVGGANGKVTFAGPTGTLQIDTAWSFAGKVAGFGAQERIDLADVAFGPQTALGYSGSNHKLTVSDGFGNASIALLGNYIASNFATVSDGHGGTMVTFVPQGAEAHQFTAPHN